MSPKLPATARAVFDNPLRPTAVAAPAPQLPAAPPLAAVPHTAEPLAVVTSPASVSPDVASPPPPAPAKRRAESAPKSKQAAPADYVKMTIYVRPDQDERLETVVFKRRRKGDRIGVTDLLREIIDAHFEKNPS